MVVRDINSGKSRYAGLVAAGAVAVAAFSGAASVGAPTANASCISVWGIGNSASCTSKLFGVAIAIGNNAYAHADALFGAAFTVGDFSSATTTDPLAFAINAGNNANVKAGGLFAIAANLGPNTDVTTEGSGSLGNLGLNIAVSASPSGSVGSISGVKASGIGNVAVNLLGGFDGLTGTNVVAGGVANIATNVGGKGNAVGAGLTSKGFLNSAFAIGGGSNLVQAGPGPLAVAISIAQEGETVKKSSPGININNKIKGPGTAAVNPGKAAKAASAKHSAARR